MGCYSSSSVDIVDKQAVSDKKKKKNKKDKKIAAVKNVRSMGTMKILRSNTMLMKAETMEIINEPSNKLASSTVEQNYHLSSGKVLGKGAYGTVIKTYARNDINKERPFAIKIIDKNMLELDAAEEISNEMQILWALDHPNVVKYHETYSDWKKMYLVMEFCPYNILDSQDGSNEFKIYPENEARDLIKQLLSAMCHYNAHGVIHRDIKPDNIMIGQDGRPRFCDFGVAKKISTQNKLHSDVGTDQYKAPEIHKHNYDEKCDIWSLAIVIYQMVTGDVPFDIDAGVGKLIKDIREGNYKPLPE